MRSIIKHLWKITCVRVLKARTYGSRSNIIFRAGLVTEGGHTKLRNTVKKKNFPGKITEAAVSKFLIRIVFMQYYHQSISCFLIFLSYK